MSLLGILLEKNKSPRSKGPTLVPNFEVNDSWRKISEVAARMQTKKSDSETCRLIWAIYINILMEYMYVYVPYVEAHGDGLSP